MAQDPLGLQPTEEARRKSDRVLGPVPIRIIGMDANGTAFTEDAVTVSFNQQGARISLVHSLLIDDVVLVLNKRTGIEEEFRVVGAFEEVIGGRREWGVEASVQDGKIWGVEFSAPSEQLQPKALIECGGCKRVVQSEMSSIEYDVLLAIGMISRHCTKCSETTRWGPSVSTTLPEIEHKRQPAAQAGERRKAKRIRLAMRIRARNSWGVIDVAQTRDVSKHGVCFFTTKVFNMGDEVFLVLPFAANSVPVETKGKIIWQESAKEGRYCGVQYIK